MTMRLALVTAGVGLFAVAGLSGCTPNANQFSDSHSTESKLDEVRFSGGAGSLTVRTGGGAQTTIERRVHYTDTRPGTTDHVDGATLVLDMDCGRNCWVDYTVTTPAAVALSGQLSSGSVTATGAKAAAVRTSSGEISLNDVTGSVTAHSNSGAVKVRNASDGVVAETSSGELTVADARQSVTAQSTSGKINLSQIGGAVTAKASSGDIQGDALAGPRCGVETSSGNITLTFTGTPDVTAQASSGNVRLTVPAGQSYKVTADSSSGNREVNVPTDPNAAHSLQVKTSSGNITIRNP